MDPFRSIARFVDHQLQHSFSSGFDKSTKKRDASLFTQNNDVFLRQKRA